ncbi:hypothetical protein N7449_010325 [Penicillium cf. viridicatum]|uniref:Uncharacterized protein n=1 Tax=Penicillium cf. viridicatum TaxID=2972119 RepID=A0A9W9M2L6_9EURO|nr:hypothetical protein N7449_010325 [Penicillium cf. viridicatum]
MESANTLIGLLSPIVTSRLIIFSSEMMAIFRLSLIGNLLAGFLNTGILYGKSSWYEDHDDGELACDIALNSSTVDSYVAF